MATVTWSLVADFDRDGVYEFDLTPYVDRPSHNLRVSRGIGKDGKPKASKLSITLTNRDGTFTPENSASSLYGLLTPGVPVQLAATHSAVGYTICTSYAMSWDVGWAVGQDATVTMECVDLFWFLQNGEPVNVTVSTSRDTDAALVAICDALGLVAGDRNFDDGVQDLPMHFAVGENPMQAMMDVAASEMGGMLYPGADGRIRFEARNARLGTTVDQTWGDGTSIVPQRLKYSLNPQEFYTSVTARSTVFRSGQADRLMFEFSQNMFTKPSATSMFLSAGTVWKRTFQANSAYLALTSPVAVVDYLANTAQNGTGTDRTSSLNPTVADLGGGRFELTLAPTQDLYVTMFKLRGQPVEFFADRAEAVFSLSVPNLKAGLGLQYDVPFAGDTGQKLRDYAYQELRVGRYPFPMLTLGFRALFDAEHAALLALELGDLVRFTDLTGAIGESSRVDDWWYVEGLDYALSGDWFGEAYDVTVTLVPSYVYRNLDAIVFDTFDRADATGDLGTSFSDDAWADDAGFNIVSNAARANTDTLSMPNVNLGASITDQVIEVSLAAVGTGDEVGVVFRYADANNQYRAYVDKGSNEVILEKNVAGVVTEISSPAFTVGTSHEMRVLNQATRIRVWVDRRLYIDTTDSGLSAGTKVGLFARNANGSTTFEAFYGQGL